MRLSYFNIPWWSVLFVVLSICLHPLLAQDPGLNVKFEIVGAPETLTLQQMEASLPPELQHINSLNTSLEPLEAKPVCIAGYYCPPGTAMPLACPLGSYQPTYTATSSQQCLSCPAGYFCSNASLMPTPCGVGMYQPNVNASSATACRQCPSGLLQMLSNATSLSQCLSCPNGTLGSVQGCVACTAGYYCVKGVMRTCPAGFLSTVNASECTLLCPPGFYCPSNGSAVPCSIPGTYASGGAGYSCPPCPAGYRCLNFTTPTFCEPNAWSSPGSTNCTLQCPVGSVCPGNGQLSCRVCPPSTFVVRQCSSYTGDTVCSTQCPPGMFGAFYTNGFCRNCDLGTYNSNYGMTTCHLCSPGFYANTTGNSVCGMCPNGSTTDYFTGYIACQKTCVPSPGYYCPSTTGLTILCPPGYYCTGDVNNDHIPCPVNTFNPDSGGSSLGSACQYCPKFMIAGSVGLTSCSLCAAGTYYTDNGGSGPNYAPVCHACSPGTSSIMNSTSCSDCMPGTYSNSVSQTCSQCRPGSYQNQPGSALCIACAPGTYTYLTNVNGTLFSPIWGASSSAQCIGLPTSGAPLVCLPGTYMQSGTCILCPIGYYCPSMQASLSDPTAIRACPGGSMSAAPGAISQSDCVVSSILQPYTFDSCSIAPGGSGAMNGLVVTASVTSLSTGTLFFTTRTAVYRVFLQGSTLELLTGAEGTSAFGAAADAIGTDAFFTSLTAIGVDYDAPEATVIVVGDGNAVRMVNVFTRQVTLLGSVGDVTSAGGIALRRDSLGSRKAYVSDVVRNRIMVFDLQNLQSNIVAGDLRGNAGSNDGSFPTAMFSAPKGIAFIEKYMNSSKMLLVVDSGNKKIRLVDTDSRIVYTWFAPLDKINPELVNPTSISVAINSPLTTTMIYVADNGKVSAIQFPLSTDTSVKVLTRLTMDSGLNVGIVLPYGSMSSGMGSRVGYTELLVFDTLSHSMRALVQDLLVLTPAGGGSAATCHLACENSNCAPLQPAELCGNSFLDPGEECDDGGAPGGGCDISTCTIKAGYACPQPLTACLEPCPAYAYAPTGINYCSQDCLALSPPSGYTIDSQCALHDINECDMGTANCAAQALCANTMGSYTCTCAATLFGDGLSCASKAYAVYALVDIPTYQSSLFSSALSSPGGPVSMIIDLLKHSYAMALLTFLPTDMLANSGYTLNTTELALLYTSLSVDPSIQATTRVELVTLFPTMAMANAAASGITASILTNALSKAILNNRAGVNVFQAPMVRAHSALDFSSPNLIDGWGMNITGINYNRTCVVSGATPTGGCWQIEMIYVGGQELPNPDEQSTGAPAPIQQSKNVLYIPRIDHDPTTFKLLNPSQALTETSGMYFPCSTTSGATGITRPATACCLRDFEALYRPHADFATFLNGADYTNGVPSDVCDAQQTFNDTYPASDVIFTTPAGQTNDLVVGKIEGMSNSEVRLLETIDYSTRTFRVLLVLEEGDLRLKASLLQGDVGSDYNLTFFVGLANFKGTGGSVMTTRNVQQFITVRKSNTLTLSTYGANQDPLISAIDMQLIRIKVTDFFLPVQYLYYLQPLFTMPSRFSVSPSGQGIVPLSSIRLIKSTGNPSASDASWMQACASTDNKFIYANTSLQNLVARAQNEQCVQSYLQMCAPPQQVSSLVSFGIPLPMDMITSKDLTANPPETIEVEFIVEAFDTQAKADVLTSLSFAVQLNALGLNAQCETMSASQTLADIITGNIYIGTATNDYEWDNTMQKKINMDVPGTTPSNSLQFSTTTVQGSLMTFAALGDPSYFEDARALTQTVNINDIYTVNFLEPLGGGNGPTPNFDAVKALFLAGQAFSMHTDAANHTSWLEPTPALLAICPLKPSIGHLVCVTKAVSTIKNDVLKRNLNDVVELRPGDATSVPELQGLMGSMLLNGGSNSFTETLGTEFSAELISKLNLNTRYRKAYVVNPVVDWSYQALQTSQPGSTAFTVCSKIIAIGMITISTPSGTQLVRRLLSTTFDMEPSEPPPPVEHSRRALLQQQQQGTTSLAPTKSQVSNSMVLSINAPGYDAATQLCKSLLNAPYSRCSILQFQTLFNGSVASELCLADAGGILGNNIYSSLQVALKDPLGFSQIAGVVLLDYTLQGCSNTPSGGSRRLLQQQGASTTTPATTTASPSTSGATTDATMIAKLLISNVNGTSILVPGRLNTLTNLLNSQTLTSILGGGGFVDMISIVFRGNNLQFANITLEYTGNYSVKNPNVQTLENQLAQNLRQNGFSVSDVLFQTNAPPVNSRASALAVFSINLLIGVSGALALMFNFN